MPRAEIPVSGSDRPALIDEEDLPLVSKFRWHKHPAKTKRYDYIFANVKKDLAIELGVAVTTMGAKQKQNKKGVRKMGYTRIGLHRLVMRASAGELVDHRGHDTYDCRKSQLRVTTFAGSSQNRRKNKDRAYTSVFKGVHWQKGKNRWRAMICQKLIGYFADETEAARAYDAEALCRFGPMASLNFEEEFAEAAS